MQWQDPEGDVRAIKAAAYAAFGCAQEPLQFNYQGYDAVLKASRHGNRVGAKLRVRGNLYGVGLTIRARGALHGAPTNQSFDPRLAVSGSPQDVVRCWLGPEVQAACAELPILSVEAKARNLVLILHTDAAKSPDYLRHAAYAAVHLLQTLPAAIQAAGLGHYLAAGTLAAHPEVVEHRKRQAGDRRREIITAIVIVVVLLGLFGAILANAILR